MEKKTKKRHSGLIITLILLLAVGIFYCWGSIYYDRDRQIDRIVNSLSDPSQDMTDYVTPSNPDIKTTAASLRPLQQYFKENKQAARRLAKNLRSGKDTEQIELVQRSNRFLIFPKYTILVQVYRPQVETNHAGSTLTVDKKNYGVMEGGDQNYYQDLGLVYPGRYHVAVKTKVSGRKLKADAVVNVWSNKTINMTIKTGTFQIRSVPNGVVYINDKKVKTLNDHGQATFKNYPLAKDTELYIQTTYNGKKIRSEKVRDLSTSIRSEFSSSDDDSSDYGSQPYAGNNTKDVYQDVEGDYIVNPIWTGLITREEAEKILEAAYTEPSSDSFENGKYNEDFKPLQKEVKKFKKGKKKLKVSVRVIKIMPAGENLSDVTYQLMYKYREKGKKHTEKVTYNNAIFHSVNKNQLIRSLGDKEKDDK